ncbi:MAG: hypothetical protein H6853_07660 [Rhodospirillales bacterium]|nr:hypothetical protein [Alphaproteobacteria bacterium]USO03396.1 MAG: hypothetical protein H6853_07660 [Rhodospirillales bacterium]
MTKITPARAAASVGIAFAAALFSTPVSADSIPDMGQDAHYIKKSLQDVRTKMVEARGDQEETLRDKLSRQHMDRDLEKSCRDPEPSFISLEKCVRDLRSAYTATVISPLVPDAAESQRLNELNEQITDLEQRLYEEETRKIDAGKINSDIEKAVNQDRTCRAMQQSFGIITQVPPSEQTSVDKGDREHIKKQLMEDVAIWNPARKAYALMDKDHADILANLDQQGRNMLQAYLKENCPKPATP